MKVNCVILMTFVCSCAFATPLKSKFISEKWSSLNDLEKIISEIPKEDRKDFVKYCVVSVLKEKYENGRTKSTAFNVNNSQKFENIKISSDTKNLLYDMIQTNYALSDDDLLRYVAYGPICFPSGCVDPGDIGSLCCPFMIKRLPMKY